jgi:hypothetical protein
MEKFKKYWIVSVNNYLCDAAYNGKLLKEKHRLPSFRKFYYIKSEDDLIGFTERNNISNKQIVEQCLINNI